MSKQLTFVDSTDKYRTLLTDVLPYETTLIFSNEGFHSLIQNIIKQPQIYEKALEIVKSIKKRYGSAFIPYSFSIIRKDTKKRKLSLPHPIMQLDLCDIYESYADYIIYLCSKSNFSIRYPSSITSKFYKKGCLIENEGDDSITASNYFVYSKYRLLYKFYDSRQFRNSEKKFTLLRKLDITNCFSSIYTHTISWAVKTKEIAKEQIGFTNFEKRFDDFMQSVNYKETAGIIIGPEFSRIFAEIIFQRIDTNIEKRLQTEFKFQLYRDYEICRYVDDIFVFANKMEVLELIESVIQEELDPYRLHLNDSKEKDYSSPFASEVSSAKDELQFLFNDLSESITIKENKLIFNLNNISVTSFTSRLKNILYRNKTSIYSVDSYLFYRLKKIIKKISIGSLEINKEDKNNSIEWIELFLEISFYIFSLDIRITSSNKLSFILLSINSFIKQNKSFNKNDIDNINKIIFDEILRLIKKEIFSKKNEFIEIANLLLILKSFKFTENIPEIIISDLVNQVLNTSQVDYFSLTTLLAFTSNVSEYVQQRDQLLNYIKNLKIDFRKTEHILLFFDYLTYPDISRNDKLLFIKKINSNYSLAISSVNQEKMVDYLSRINIFTDWSSDINYSKKLMKKEFIAPYE